jgi:hypothetical protein
VNSWIARITIILVVAGFVAALLPGVREWLAVDACLDSGAVYDYANRVCRTDVQSLPSHPIRFLQVPDQGSLVVAALVAIALLRVFVTLERRSKAAAAAA